MAGLCEEANFGERCRSSGAANFVYFYWDSTDIGFGIPFHYADAKYERALIEILFAVIPG